ncbi:MAG TPA: SIMPL domain-containing protein [Clostridiales bacterium]|nr:SIMPL domain-containing protein [Clostridiales bacterium]
MRTIKVTGKGNIKVAPDTTRLTLTLTGSDTEYGKALKASSEDTLCLKDLLEGLGFKRSDLKTIRFSVDPRYESYKNKDAYKQRLTGYEFTHVLKLEFPSDNERLGKTLFALANGKVSPEVRISYTVSDPESVKNGLLSKAVADAKDKAAVLAEASGVTLKDIQSIDYSWSQIEFESQPMRGGFYTLCEGGSGIDSYDIDMEPEDIEKSDEVTVVWEIA